MGLGGWGGHRVGLSKTRYKYVHVRSASAIPGSGRFWKDLPDAHPV